MEISIHVKALYWKGVLFITIVPILTDRKSFTAAHIPTFPLYLQRCDKQIQKYSPNWHHYYVNGALYVFRRIQAQKNGWPVQEVGLIGLDLLQGWFAPSQWETSLLCNDVSHWLGAKSRFAPSQWETVLLCNDVTHWLGANLESA